jgi:hypothetical protein
MAHLAKYTFSSAQMLFHHNLRHKDRKGEYVAYGGSKIDTTKTHLNYRLDPNTDPNEFITQRLSEIKVQKRADVKVYCSWVLTVPQNLPTEKHREFFESAYRFFCQDYGKENIVMASVHLDETTPHMHLGFVPVVREKKNKKKLGQEKVSAKELLTRSYLECLHKRLKNALERDLNCQVDITIDRDEDAPKREYVPLATLKKQTEAEAKKLQDLKQEYAELSRNPISTSCKNFVVAEPSFLETKKEYAFRVLDDYRAFIEPDINEMNAKIHHFNDVVEQRNWADSERRKAEAARADTERLLKAEQAEHEQTKQELAKEKEAHEKTRTMFESSKNFYSTLLEGIRLFAQTYLRDISMDGQRICELPIRELARCFVSYCKKHMEQEQIQQKQINRRQNGPER